MSPMADLAPIRARLSTLGRAHTPADVVTAMRAEGLLVSDASVLDVVSALRRESVGAGPLEPLLRVPGVTDVVVNGPTAVFLDRGEGLEPTDVRFGSEDEVRRLAARLAASVGRRLDDAVPFVDARLADGTRFHAVIAPVAAPGTCLSLRVPGRRLLSLEELGRSSGLGRVGLGLLRRIVASRAAFLVSGGTGTGKTTLLAAMLGEVPAAERIVVVEDSRELDPAHPHVVRLEGRPPNAEGAGRVTMADLVRQSLRMRPDRLVVGEVRGAEICDLLSAMNTGHEGGCGTLHANSALDVPSRVEALAALGGLGREAAHAQLASAVDVGIHLRRRPDRTRTIGQVVVFERGPDGLVRAVEAMSGTSSGLVRGPGWERLDTVLDR